MEESTWLLFELADHYRAGHLPEAGGILDQSASLMAAIAHINKLSKAPEDD